MKFTKMQGAGNDYIYIDCIRELPPEDPSALAVEMSRQHYGVGADGVILILPSTRADCRMRMFNSDGSESQMCGNGIRCLAKYLYDQGLAPGRRFVVETGGGLREVEVLWEKGNLSQCRVSMGKPSFTPSSLPVLVESGGVPVTDFPVEALGRTYHFTLLSLGNPHAVCVAPSLADVDIEAVGRIVENHPAFPERVNVEFVEIYDRRRMRMRVWERGSGITLACGTGACASVVATAILNKTEREALVELDGGTLDIFWEKDGGVTMTGPAVEVFSGEWRASRGIQE